MHFGPQQLPMSEKKITGFVLGNQAEDNTLKFSVFSYSKDDEKDIFTFIWKIENFSACTYKTGSSLRSPVFRVEFMDQTEWFLSLYPKGIKNNDDHFSFYLGRTDTDEGPRYISIVYKVTVVPIEGFMELSKQSKEIEYPRGTDLGYQKFFKRADILEQRSVFLPDDILTIRVDMWRSFKTKNLVTGCRAVTRVANQKLNFTWPIEGFVENMVKLKEAIQIPFPRAQGYKFEMTLQLAEDDQPDKSEGQQASDGFVKIYLRMTKEVAKPTLLITTISVLDRSGKVRMREHGEHLFESAAEIETWLFPPFIEILKVIDEKDTYLPKDTLTLCCEMVISEGIEGSKIEQCEYFAPKTQPCVTSDGRLTLSDDLKWALRHHELCDVKLRAGTEVYPAHRLILCSRSNVLRNLFERFDGRLADKSREEEKPNSPRPIDNSDIEMAENEPSGVFQTNPGKTDSDKTSPDSDVSMNQESKEVNHSDGSIAKSTSQEAADIDVVNKMDGMAVDDESTYNTAESMQDEASSEKSNGGAENEATWTRSSDSFPECSDPKEDTIKQGNSETKKDTSKPKNSDANVPNAESSSKWDFFDKEGGQTKDPTPTADSKDSNRWIVFEDPKKAKDNQPSKTSTPAASESVEQEKPGDWVAEFETAEFGDLKRGTDIVYEEGETIVDFHDLDPDSLQILINFLYTDKLETLVFECVMKLFVSASKLEIVNLKEMCRRFLMPRVTIGNVCKLLQYADYENNLSLKGIVKDYVRDNMTAVLLSDEWYYVKKCKFANEILDELRGMRAEPVFECKPSRFFSKNRKDEWKDQISSDEETEDVGRLSDDITYQ